MRAEEAGDRDDCDTDCHQVFKAVHLVNLMDFCEAEQRQHDESKSNSEIAAVNGQWDDSQHSGDERLEAAAMFFGPIDMAVDAALQKWLKDKQHDRKHD